MNFKGISNGISKSLIAKLLVFVLAILFLSLVTVSTVFGILGIHSTEDTARAILTETSRTAALAVQNKIEATENIIKEIGTTASLSNAEVPVEEKRQILASKSEQ